jgi:hypothetical protein
MKKGISKPHTPIPGRDVPTNPIAAPQTGDANLPEPTDVAEQATWQPYRSTTAHAEPSGHLDDRGVRTQDAVDNEQPRQQSNHGALRDSPDKDE